MIVSASPRSHIYYWKCDRPAAFHGTEERGHRMELEGDLRRALAAHFDERDFPLAPAGGQGNHITFRARLADEEVFIRVEDGPECDDYMAAESRVIAEVRAIGVPASRVLAVDASRRQVPFAWQVLEYIPHPDLNELRKRDALDLEVVAQEIGAAVALWQGIEPRGFGPFDPALTRLESFHASYADYFHLHFDRHLRFLAERGFLSSAETRAIGAEIERHRDLLALERGCLVHKDLALWNILGTTNEIAAFIDWDDAISGDPMDDLSLLGCFYDGAILARALHGYAAVRPLPHVWRRRFWLHLLRNMIVKAVIRVGAGYFDRTDSFYLIGAGTSGADLQIFTHARLTAALHGLREDRAIETL